MDSVTRADDQKPATATDGAAATSTDDRTDTTTGPVGQTAATTATTVDSTTDTVVDTAAKTADTTTDDGTAKTTTDDDAKTTTTVATADETAKTTTDGDQPTKPDTGTDPTTGGRRRRVRVPFAHAVRRLPPPRQAVAATNRAVRDWSKRPSGRLTLPALLLLALVAMTGAAGAILVPATASTPRAKATVSPSAANPDWSVLPGPDLSVGPVAPSGTPSATPPGLGIGGRPADALATWAQQISSRINVSTTALQAYGYAELVIARTTPSCRLSWTTLAAIGSIESNHGQHNGAILFPDGQALPKIYGPPLNGKNNNKLIRDTDQGLLDSDTTYDRAVGPMQFIPSTWKTHGADADNDGVKNPHDIDDAALAAGNYLCSGNRDLTTAAGWWNAILSYNNVQAYAQQVFDTANRYGTASRT